MAEGMNREGMVKTSLYKCIFKDRADIAGSDRLRSDSSAMALEHEVITGKMLSVDTQQDKQLGRNGHTAVFLAFPLIDEKLLAVKADVNPFKAAGLTNPESTVIDGGEQRLVIQVTPMKQKCNLLLGEDSWKSLGLTDTRKDKSSRFLDAHDLVVFLQPEYGMLEKGNTVTVPVQKHRQVIFDVFLGEIVRQLVEIQHSLRNLQSVVIDSTIRVLSQAEFLCEKGNTIPKFRYGLNGLVQVCIGHGVLWCRGIMMEGLRVSPSSPCTFRKTEIN